LIFSPVLREKYLITFCRNQSVLPKEKGAEAKRSITLEQENLRDLYSRTIAHQL